jgi:hypothetical protein
MLGENENADIKIVYKGISGFSSLLPKLQIVQADFNFILTAKL